MFGQEPFSLQEIYVEVECGTLTWGEIKKTKSLEKGPHREALDPFVEKHGGRQPLLHTVLGLLGDDKLRDAIVIQGVAGAGKSTFTLRLCAELRNQGLRPIRVRLRDLKQDLPIRDALAQAVEFYDPAQGDHPAPDLARLDADSLLPELLADDSVVFRDTRISRSVLILDGWDELSVGGSGNLHDRIERTLSQIRSEFLDRPRGSNPIRVVLTGRPSTSVEESKFLRDGTPILTVRPLNPQDLRTLVGKLTRVFVRPSDLFPEGHKPIDPKMFDRVYATYDRDYEQLAESGRTASETGPLGVLGHPLLAQVVVRLVAFGAVEPEALIVDPTALYRTLVDVTVGYRAQIGGNEPDDDQRIRGPELRRLLWYTATAITISGKESVSRTELEYRLPDLDRRCNEKDRSLNLDQIDEATRQNEMSEFLVSYYFKTGHLEAGCEFAHKAFREYLFAEAIVEALKEHARYETESKRIDRAAFWMDFAETDPRYRLSRTLGQLLAPVWLSPEVENYVRNLIVWEIGRDTGQAEARVGGLKATSTDTVSLEQWARIRDDLADLWEWWGEGVHLRPQVRLKAGQIEGKSQVYALELVDWCMPKDLPRRAASPPTPPRTVTVDSHLGAGLLQLCVATHRGLLERKSAFENYLQAIAKGASRPERSPRHEEMGRRPYQFVLELDSDELIFFDPSSDNNYLFFYMARINAAGWRPQGPFAGGGNLTGVWISGANLSGANLSGANLSGANLSGANLSGADLSRANLRRANLRGANLREADLRGANLRRANLSGANLSEADLRGANLREADLSEANLSEADLSRAYLSRAYLGGADLSEANLREANLSGANLSGANLSGANLSGANLSGANLSGANLSGANLSGANLSGADLSGADLSEANLRGANLSGANLSGADLREANLRGANLRGAHLGGANLSGADLREANLSGAVGLTPDQIRRARIDPSTKLSDELATLSSQETE